MGLRECPSKDLWPLIEETWEREAHNDYGAHYFFIHLLGSRSDWPLPAFDHVLKIIKESIVNRRPQFRKSRAAAIQAFQNLCPDLFIDDFPDFLAENLDPPWDCRYATVMCIDRNSGVDKLVKEEIFNRFIGDSDSFVRARAVKSLANSTD
jgi:bilin biosynthesis protein